MFQSKFALPAERYFSARTSLFMLFLMLFIVATRWLLAPQYLYYFDSANFALSLEHFDPSLHQPQPPGYAMFVLLIRIVHLVVEAPERVLLIAGILAAVAAVLLIRKLASEISGPAAGLLSAALLASNPAFWFGGITNQVRLFLAVCTLAVGLLAWRALKRDSRWLYAAFAGNGIAAGFRPELSVLLLPLLIWVWYRTGRGLVRLAIGFALLAAASVPWLAATVIAVGGIPRLMDVLWSYVVSQFQGTSAVFGAPAPSARHMFAQAVVWNLLGPLAWIWVLPALRWSPLTPERREKAGFLLLAFLPPFLFSAFIHIGDPDQALASVSILAVLGGILLAAFLARIGSRRVLLLAGAMVAIHTVTFFVPPGKLAKASSYRAVAAVDRMNTAAIRSVRSLRRDGPLTIVHYGSSVSSRHLSYYFPEDYVVVLPGGPGRDAPGEGLQVFYRHQPLPAPSGGVAPILNESHRILCLLPYNSRPADLPGWQNTGPIYYRDRAPGSSVTIGPYTLVSQRTLISGAR